MNLIGLPCISAAGGNMGFGNCKKDLRNAKAFLLSPAGTKIPASQFATFIADVLVNLRNDDKYARWQLVTGIKGVTKANIEAATATWGDGSTEETRSERIGRTYDFNNVCAFIGVSTLRGKEAQYDIWPIYDGNEVQGTQTTMADGEPAVSGFTLDSIMVPLYTEAINETQAMWQFTFQLASGDEWRNMVVIQPEDGNLLKDLASMQTVELEWRKNDPQVAGTYQVLARTSCGSVNMSDMYGTELAVASLWNVTNAATGNAITVSGVTVNGLGNFVLALLTTDPDYTAATKIKITLVAPSLLAAEDISQGVSYYEATTIVIPK